MTVTWTYDETVRALYLRLTTTVSSSTPQIAPNQERPHSLRRVRIFPDGGSLDDHS